MWVIGLFHLEWGFMFCFVELLCTAKFQRYLWWSFSHKMFQQKCYHKYSLPSSNVRSLPPVFQPTSMADIFLLHHSLCALFPNLPPQPHYIVKLLHKPALLLFIFVTFEYLIIPSRESSDPTFEGDHFESVLPLTDFTQIDALLIHLCSKNIVWFHLSLWPKSRSLCICHTASLVSYLFSGHLSYFNISVIIVFTVLLKTDKFVIGGCF